MEHIFVCGEYVAVSEALTKTLMRVVVVLFGQAFLVIALQFYNKIRGIKLKLTCHKILDYFAVSLDT
jgi:hypothetical protein